MVSCATVRDIFIRASTILAWTDIIGAIAGAAFRVGAVVRIERIVGVSNAVEANVSPQWPALHGELARFDGILRGIASVFPKRVKVEMKLRKRLRGLLDFRASGWNRDGNDDSDSGARSWLHNQGRR